MIDEPRPDPDALLREISREQARRGRLKIFLGYAPGVGKTYTMLQEAHVLKARGEDVVVGIAETHGRVETKELLRGLDIMPCADVPYEGIALKEFDVDAALARRPALILVDELAHTNAPGSRHPKRYQDVEDLLKHGIDVYTTVNIQHFESQVDVVARITGVRVQETVPDTILDRADEVQVIDIPLEELTQRLKEGKVYIPEQARRAMDNFFQRGNLVALRELTLTIAARKMGTELLNYMRAKAIAGPWPAGERVMACIGPSVYAPQLLRKAYTIAKDANAEWYAVYVSSPTLKELSTAEKAHLSEALRIAEELGAKTVTLMGGDIAEEILRFAADNNITRVVLGKPLRSALGELVRPSPVHRLLHADAPFELHLITPVKEKEAPRPRRTARRGTPDLKSYALTTGMVCIVTLLNAVLESLVPPTSLVFIYLIITIGAAVRFGTGQSLFASALSLLAFDFFFTQPRYSFTMLHASDIISIVIFVFTSIVVGQLVKVTRQQGFALHLRLRRVSLVEDMSKELLSLPPVEQLIGGFADRADEWKHVLALLRTTVLDDISHIVIRYVSSVIDVPSFVLFTAQDGKLRTWARTKPTEELDGHEMTVAQWAFTHGEIAGAGTQTLPSVGTCFIPMKIEDQVIGLIGLKMEYRNLLADERRMLGTIANISAIGAVRWVNV